MNIAHGHVQLLNYDEDKNGRNKSKLYYCHVILTKFPLWACNQLNPPYRRSACTGYYALLTLYTNQLYHISVCTSRHKLPFQHGVCRSLLLVVVRVHHRVASWPGSLGVVCIKSSQLLSSCHGVAG